MGCLFPLYRHTPQLKCRFFDTGFTICTTSFKPCLNRYHTTCFKAGVPFPTRLKNNEGLRLPSSIKNWAHFICESCTVRAVLGRELHRSPQDTSLLMLERMRIIDLANHWAAGTTTTYNSKFTVIQEFERDYQVAVLSPTPLAAPPHGPAIRLMWAQERYCMFPSRWKRSSNLPVATVRWGTIRALRSAAGQFWAWDLIQTNPDRLMRDSDNRPILVDRCSPTDELVYTLFSDGMKRRLGEHTDPATALLDQHVRWIDEHFHILFTQSTTALDRILYCQAAIANLAGWLGWLRAMETFSLTWGDITIVPPAEAASLGLPDLTGMVSLRLLPQTKSNRTMTADVILAYESASGFNLGLWFFRLIHLVQPTDPAPCIFQHPNGTVWSSHFFRHTFLYPLLELQQTLGDPYLQRFDGTPGNSIKDKFWSFHCYRRGARTHVSRKRVLSIRSATGAEVSEHARWRRSRQGMDMPTAYLEWSLTDRLMITLLCM